MIRVRRTATSAARLSMKRRLRILHVIDSLGVGGAEQLLVTLARHIDREHYDLHVCGLAPLGDTPIVRDLRELDVPVHGLSGARRHDPRHVLQVASLLRQHNIDILHSHLPYGHLVGALAGTIARRPVVSTLHSIRDTDTRCADIKLTAKRQALRWRTHTVIACAPEVHAAARERLRLPASKLVDVRNGIDIKAYANTDSCAVEARRRELVGDGAGPLVITVGNLKPAKGHEYLVTAARLAMKRVPNMKIAIVGGSGASEHLVRERILALGLGGRVLLTGPRRDIADLLAAADLFVLPSVWEGLPLSLLEAMAAGKPVVATSVGGVPGVIEDGVTGRLVQAGDAEMLARAMVELLCNPDKAQRLAAAGCAHVRETYGADIWARHLQSIYEEVVGGRRCSVSAARCG